MAEIVIVYGRSGSGKSFSLMNFSEKEALVIQSIKKRLPFKNGFKYILLTDDVDLMLDKMSKMPCKVAVIDDAGFIMTNSFMANHSQPKYGANQFQLYNDIADKMYKLFMGIKMLPDDVIVYVILHEDISETGDVKLRTIGKLLDQKCPLESLVTIALRCVIEGENQHVFKTQNCGMDVSKSPVGMFDSDTIPNDLKLVDTKIREFYGMTEEKKEGEKK